MPRRNLPGGKRALSLTFPFQGLDQRFDYQYQPPYTTPIAENMRPTAYGSGRQQGSTRPGLAKIVQGASAEPAAGGSYHVQLLTTTVYVSGSSIVSKLLKVLNGTLYKFSDTLLQFSAAANTGGLSLHATKTLQAAERDQILYIADHDDDPAVSSAARRPKKYNPATDTLSAWTATAGTIPYGCPVTCLWRDRLLLSGGTSNPYGLYASRQGAPTDWDYSKTDVGSAWSLGLAQAGQIGETVTALIPHADNCLIVGCPNSLWIVRGDPNDGGQAGNLSPRVGILSKNAWCQTPDGLLVFLSKDGLYAIPAGCQNAESPQSLSRERLPIALVDIDPDNYEISLAYDMKQRGIHIFVTDVNNLASGQHYFLDWQLKSFWPVSYGTSNYDPYCCHERRRYTTTISGGESHVVFGCRDGYARRYFASVTDTDDGTPLESSLYLGPFGDAGLLLDTRVDALHLSLTGVKIAWSLYTGDTPYKAVNATQAAVTGNLLSTNITASQWRHPQLTPRVRGASLYLALSSTNSWQFVSGTIILSPVGKTRV